MKNKEDIVKDWLPRYTGTELGDFGEYILLTNFHDYVNRFAERFDVEVLGGDGPMQTATSDNITMINFGMGSPQAATVMDLLSAVSPKAALFLGKCGGLKEKISVGDLILPIAAIRGEGTSSDYLPKEIPALPSFRLQTAVSHSIRKYEQDYWTGTVYSTNRRYGNTMASFVNICAGPEPAPSIWKPPPSSRWALLTRSLTGRCYWCLIYPCCPKALKPQNQMPG